MEKRTKDMPAVKAVTFLAFVVLVALGVFFVLGMVEQPAIDLGEMEGMVGVVADKKTYGITWVIDEIKLIIEDAAGYFKGIWEAVQTSFKAIEKGNGIADMCMTALTSIYPVVTLLCFVMVALRVVFFWTPFVRLGSIGWSRVALRMGKKVKKTIGWVIGYLVYTFAVYGGEGVMELLLWGKVALYVIAGYAVARVLLDGIGKKSIVNTVFTTISTAAIAVLTVLVFERLLFETALWPAVFVYVEEAVCAIQGEGKNTELMLECSMHALCWLFVFIALQRTAKILQKQVNMDRGGVRKSLIWLLIWIVAAAALNFFAYKKGFADRGIPGFDFKAWKELEEGKYFFKSVIYGAIGLGLVIVTPILNCIGRKKEIDE